MFSCFNDDVLTSDFDYKLPKSAIAQSPASPRDHSRLMVVDREKRTIEHRHFFELGDFLKKGDLLVWNNSKVFRARLRGTTECESSLAGKKEGNDLPLFNACPVEVFLLRPMENHGVWRALAKPGRKLRLGMKIKFAEDFSCEVLLKEPDGTLLIQFSEDDLSVRAKANKYGEVPTPPYIHPVKSGEAGPPLAGFNRVKSPPLEVMYQTIYAKNEGSVAAPTAGFHFTEELIEKLKGQGIEFAEITLHVGLGTFQPVKSERIETHKIHSEWAELTAKNADLINQAKAEGRRVIAVGTTTTRTLEAAAPPPPFSSPQAGEENKPVGELRPFSGEVDLFITPGFKFKILDALITNFHLPKSTLLMLVAAFVGDREFLLKCYQEAIKENYRFYSFGDAMLII